MTATKLKNAASRVGNGVLDVAAAAHNHAIDNQIEEIDSQMTALSEQLARLQENRTKLEDQRISR
jgi:hypothetical protein